METTDSARNLEMIIDDNAMERQPVEAAAQLGSALSPILSVILTSVLITVVARYVSAKRQSFVENVGCRATGSDVNHVITILDR